ncbi:MAG: hydrogenase formation protein HypD [Bacteroidales bacterium]|jgi:hydrogenase expression/formation protein HypD|nr:hydrogenase formation protein HypD [Bacteroidales bacterium]
MKYIDEYRSPELVNCLLSLIKQTSTKEINLMEVCGGHTMAIHKFGIVDMLPKNIHLLSGPGCPVCVTDKKYIDQCIAYSRMQNTIITTYGDLIRVPGSSSSLEKEGAKGADIRMVYSTTDALEIAKANPQKKVIFLGIGFETTAPGSAVCIQQAFQENISNFYLFSAHKIMPPALKLLADGEIRIDGFICPGHVSTITGSKIYETLADENSISCVVCGFEPLDILQSIYMLVKQIEKNETRVEIQYTRAVQPEGNILAQKILMDVFEVRDDWWRGFGIIPSSGLKIRDKYKQIDAETEFDVDVEETILDIGCICGEILKGLKSPNECLLFGEACNPSNPAGACMVSNEGSCHAFYKYGKNI